MNLIDLNHPDITCSKDATAALQGLPMAQGTELVPDLLTFQDQGLERDDHSGSTPIYIPDQKAYKCHWHKGTPLYARAGIRVDPGHHLSIPGRLSVYEVVGDGWQLNAINNHVPFGEATEPSLQALEEAYRQMAMLAPTIIIGDMNAAPTLADRRGQVTAQDSAVRDTIKMLRLVDLTANLEGQPSHFPHQTEAAPSRIDVCYGAPPPSSVRRPDTAASRWDPRAIGPCIFASPSPTFPLAPQRMRTKAYHPPENTPTGRQTSLVPVSQRGRLPHQQPSHRAPSHPRQLPPSTHTHPRHSGHGHPKQNRPPPSGLHPRAEEATKETPLHHPRSLEGHPQSPAIQNPRLRGLPAEAYYHHPAHLLGILAHRLWDIVTGQTHLPPYWANAVRPLYKKGDWAYPDNLRPIVCAGTEVKVVWTILLRRICPHLYPHLPASLWGAIPGRSPHEAIILQDTIADMYPVNLIIASLNVMGAFPNTPGLLLEAIWKRMGLPFYNFAPDYIRTRKYKVRTKARLTPFLEPGSRVSQGGAEGLFLYLLVTLPLALTIEQDYQVYAPYPLLSPLVGFVDDTNLWVAHGRQNPHTPDD